MARIHNDELCPFCGGVVAYAEYKNVKEGFYGDAFSGIKYTDHECEDMIRNREAVAKVFDNEMKKINKPPTE